MSHIRAVVRAAVSTLGDDEVEVVMSTNEIARDGHVLDPRGCRLANYRANPIVLWQHSPDEPIGNAENIIVGADQITARIRFAPLGISRKADEVRGLMKAGIVRAVSVSFDPIRGVPLDPKKPYAGQRWLDWELLELSAVTVPADTGAVVTARAVREGKAISAANVAALREAHDLAERCTSTIATILGADNLPPNGEGDRRYGADRRRRAVEMLELTQAPVDPAWAARQRALEFFTISAA
ncbi:MAG: HK97 family phage prohead protease [Sphingomonadales bacterium]|nr:HK97 family phage prohead protease [Sphingomonadales bacterium]